MARHDPAARMTRLVKAATQVFIDRGYKGTQMEDIASALGVAKGTLYVYVESKDALFDLVLRCADNPHPFQDAPTLPIPTPKRGATLAYVRRRLEENQNLETLARALSEKRGIALREEFAGILRELYDRLERNREGIKLLDRSARDQPALAALWFEGARGGLVGVLSQYLRDAINRGEIAGSPDVAVAARLIVETIVYWAVHRKWDPRPQLVDDDSARETVIGLLINAFVKE